MPHSTMLRTARAAGAAAALAVTGLAAAPQAQAAVPRAAIDGSRPAWAVTSDQVSRAVTGSLRAQVYLAGRDPSGLAAFAAAVSTPGNPLYRHFLTPAQARARFGISSREIAGVRSWLTGAGLEVTGVTGSGPAGAYVSVRGSLAAAGRAFAVTFGRFRGPGGRPYRAPAQTPSVPAPLAGSVLSVTGLDTAPHLASPADTAAPAARGTGASLTSGPLCSSYFGQKVARRIPPAYGRHWPLAICGYVPQQLRHAYGVTRSGMTGRGQTVAIVDGYDSHTIRRDARRYARLTGDPVLRPGQFRQYRTGRFTLAGDRTCGAPAKWHLEQTLDVESLHGLATAAGIRYVAARSCRQQDLVNALAFIVNRHLASIVSDSWGWGASDFLLQPVANSIFRLGIAEGIGFFFSAGDTGYYTRSGTRVQIQVQFPTSSPWVTSVGGTSLAIGRRGQYRWESSWGSVRDKLVRTRKGRHWQYPPPGPFTAGFRGGGGGGVSTIYPQPFYQRGTVPPKLATKLPTGTRSRAPMRVIPDVSADANPSTGIVLGLGILRHGKYRFAEIPSVGGTSLACPTMAAIEADAQQAAGGPLGFADPAIYARYRTPAFRDVTDHPLGMAHPSVVSAGSQGTFLEALNIDGAGRGALRAVRGYDDATGVGSPGRYIESFGR